MTFMHPLTPSPGFLQRALHPTWTDLVPLVRSESGARSLPYREARLWGLVLASRHVPYRMQRLREGEGGGHTIQVQAWFADRAVNEIRLYMEENAPDGRRLALLDLRPVSGHEPTLFAMALLVLFYWVTSRTYPEFGLYPHLWLTVGSANGAAILSGEWWRLATALTLHGGGPHVAGNAVIGGVFIWLVCRRLGSGLGWLLTILAGVVGNGINILVLGVHHNAIGFSTATFGAAGVLAAIAPFGVGGGLHDFGDGPFLSRVWRFLCSALIPVAAGLGLLAMLGAGEKTDLGAHLFGFLSGIMLGGVAGFFASRLGLPGKKGDACLFAIALGLPVLCWIRAWVA